MKRLLNRPSRRSLGLLLLAAAIIYLLVALALVTVRLAGAEKDLSRSQRTQNALIRQNAATLRRIAADEARLCRAARITKFQPIIAVLCHLPYVPPTPTPTPKASTSAHTVAPSPTASHSSASPTTPDATAIPRVSPSPTPSASPACILGICLAPTSDRPGDSPSPSSTHCCRQRHHHRHRGEKPDD
ncbi:MAG: hypothetical protein WBF51_04160 [Candidatus Dormiibacterota bacterium]